MSKVNEAVAEKNCLDKYWGMNQLVRNFTRHEFWKGIGSMFLAVTYGIKGNHMCGTTKTSVNNKGQTKLDRDFCEKRYLLKVQCDLHCSHYYYACH